MEKSRENGNITQDESSGEREKSQGMEKSRKMKIPG